MTSEERRPSCCSAHSLKAIIRRAGETTMIPQATQSKSAEAKLNCSTALELGIVSSEFIQKTARSRRSLINRREKADHVGRGSRRFARTRWNVDICSALKGQWKKLNNCAE